MAHETPVAPTPEQWQDYTDNGDMVITTKTGVRLLGEVKGISYNFTVKRWCHPPHYIINNVRQHDAKDPEPDFYFTLSGDAKCVGVVDVKKTRQFWSDYRLYPDPDTGKKKKTYTMHHAHVLFFEVDGQSDLWQRGFEPGGLRT